MSTWLIPQFDRFPPTLAQAKRWAPWELAPDPKGRLTKVPRNAKRPQDAVSNKQAWWALDVARKAYEEGIALVAEGGVGFQMTNARGLVAVDLDRCVNADGSVQPWAQEIIDRAKSYTELSPSGTGIRIILKAQLEGDWQRRESDCAEAWFGERDPKRGLEVYGGSSPRYVTITGHRLADAPSDVEQASEGFLEWLAATYRSAKPQEKPSATTDTFDLVPPDELPQIDPDEMPEELAAFWAEGKADGDRSHLLQRLTSWLLERTQIAEGLQRELVLSLLAANGHVMEVALDHRGQDEDRAIEYLWDHHILKSPVQASVDDFDVCEVDAPAPKNERYDFALEKGLITDDLRGDSPPRDWVVRRALLAGKAGVLAGFGGSYKTQFLIQTAVCVALKRPVFGLEVSKAGLTALVLAEEDLDEALRRLRATVQAMELTDEEIALVRQRVLMFACAGEDVRLVSPHTSGTKRTKSADALIATLRQHSERTGLPIRFVGLDHFANLTGGKLEDASDATVLTTEFARIAAKTGAAVCVAAHMPKAAAGKAEHDQHSVFGSAFNVNNTRASLLMVRMTKEEAKQLGVREEERHDHVQLSLAKANYTKEGALVWLKAEYQPGHETMVLEEVRLTKPTPANADEAHATDRQRIVDFLQAEAEKGIKHTRSTLEDAAGRISEPAIPRARIRDALNSLRTAGCVRDEPLPAGEVSGQRKTYLAVTQKTTDLGVSDGR